MRRCLVCGANHTSCKGVVKEQHVITVPKRKVRGDSFVADRDLYADKDGKVVEADDPAKVTKIASKGSTVSDADVQKYGLKGGNSETVEGDTDEDAPSDESAAIDPEEESARIQGKGSKKAASKKK